MRQGVEALRTAGYRLTAPRRAVLEAVTATGEHLNLAEVHRRARARHPRLGRATVYRTLDLLTDLGLIRPIHLGLTGTRYTRADGGHHHMVCTGCGAVIEFDDCAACRPGTRLARRLCFRISSHLLELYGRCRKCLRKEQRA
jgi:Fur family ferric uptake transcriptional regulator